MSSTQTLPPAVSMRSSLTAIKSLQEELDILTIEFEEFSTEEVKEIVFDAIKKVAATEIEKYALQVGDKAPEFALKNIATGKMVKSSDLLKKGPLVVTFFRGDWCAYCSVTTKTLEELYPEFIKRGATLVAISPQVNTTKKQSSSVVNNNLPILSDPGNVVSRGFQVAFEVDETYQKMLRQVLQVDLPFVNGNDDPFFLPVPATYVIDPDGTILYSFIDSNHSKRAEPAEILSAIRNASDIRKSLTKRLVDKVKSLHIGGHK